MRSALTFSSPIVTSPHLGRASWRTLSGRHPSRCARTLVAGARLRRQAASRQVLCEAEADGAATWAFAVMPQDDGERLDKVMAANHKRSRAYFHELLADGHVAVNGAVVKTKSTRLAQGDAVSVVLRRPPREGPIEPEDIPLDVLYEDEHLAVVNKQANLVVHPAPGHWTGTLAHALAHRYGATAPTADDPLRAGIVHRLDKGTTGAMVVARTREAHEALAARFAERAVRKEYLCVTVGSPAAAGARGGVVEAPIGRDGANRLKMAIVPLEDGGKEAHSTYEVLAHDARGLLHVVRFRIATGRTHQVRVHARHLRAPVLGDELYGALDVNTRFRSAASRPLLHAHVLEFAHPVTDAPVRITAPVPDDMRRLISRVIDAPLADKLDLLQ